MGLFCNFANESAIPAFQNILCSANFKHILIKQQPQMIGLLRGFIFRKKKKRATEKMWIGCNNINKYKDELPGCIMGPIHT